MKISRLLEGTLLVATLLARPISECQGRPEERAPAGPLETTSVRSEIAAGPSSNETSEDNDDDDVFAPYRGERFDAFDWSLFKLTAGEYRGNLLVSPLSVKLAMVLLYEGAQDRTAVELAGVLHLPVGRWATRDKFSVILRSLRPVFNEYELDVGTRLYVDSSVDLKQSYAATVKTFYGVDVVPTNFSNPSPVADEINRWVGNVTRGNVEGIIRDREAIEDSVMLIVNALYFKGSWHKNRFSPNDTRPGKFYASPGSGSPPVDAPFMRTNGNFYYAESLELDAKILRVPYVGHKFAMYLVLPKTRAGLDDLVEKINPSVLSRSVRLMQKLPVEARIPRFKFDFTSYLERTLRQMGIRDVFDDAAALNEIARAKRDSLNLVVTNVVQKAGIEVNERGTTAHATTEIQIGNKIGEQEFIADRPFLFFIEDEITGTILYTGRLSNPLEENGSANSGDDPPTTSPSPVDQGRVTEPPISGFPTDASNDERNNYFNVELLQGVSAESSGNVVVSPLSVKVALTALVEGTGGRTRQELLSALRLPADVARMRSVARDALAPLLRGSRSGTEIRVATRVWTAPGRQASRDYDEALRTVYKGDLRSLDFTNTRNAAGVVNDWIRSATDDDARAPIESGTLDPDTILLLTSAVSFKGRWLEAFDRSATVERCFRVPNLGCKRVPMMEKISSYNYAGIESLDAEVVEIPYSNERFSMLVFLPRNEGIRSLEALSRDLSYAPISSVLRRLRGTELLLSLPRFTVESNHRLRPVLENMGIKDLFDLSSNVSGILPGASARVGSILHDAKIETNEAGTVASAATAIGIVPLMGNSFEVYRVERPFFFAIVDRPSSAILFAGRVVDPCDPRSPRLEPERARTRRGARARARLRGDSGAGTLRARRVVDAPEILRSSIPRKPATK